MRALLLIPAALLCTGNAFALSLTDFQAAVINANGHSLASQESTVAAKTEIEAAASRFDTNVALSAAYGENTSLLGTYTEGSDSSTRYGASLNKRLRPGTSLTLGLNHSIADYKEANGWAGADIVATIRQPLLKGAGVNPNLYAEDMGQLNFEMSLASHQKVKEDLALNAAILFESVTLAKAHFSLQKEATQKLNDLYFATTVRVEAGMAAKSDLLEVQSELIARHKTLQKAKTALSTALSKMSAATGASYASFDIPKHQPITRSCEEALAEGAQKVRATIARAETAAALATRTAVLKKHNLLPTIDLVLQGGLNGSASSPSTSNSWHDLAERDQSFWSAGVEARFPLGNRLAKAELKKSHAEERKTQYTLSQIRKDIASEVAIAARQYESEKSTLALAKEMTVVAQQGLEFELLRMTEGVSDTYRVLRFQQRHIDAEVAYLMAIFDNNIAWHTLQQAIGTQKARLNDEI